MVAIGQKRFLTKWKFRGIFSGMEKMLKDGFFFGKVVTACVDY